MSPLRDIIHAGRSLLAHISKAELLAADLER